MIVSGLVAQTNLGSYSFAHSVYDYTEVTDGIVIGNSSTDNQNFINVAQPLGSSETSGPGMPIGFSFYLSGYRFDRIGISANGWIALGQSELGVDAVNMRSTSSYTPISSVMSHTVPFTVSRIAGLAADLQAQTGSELRFHTFGSAPFREFIVQWKNYKKYGSQGVGDSYSFQIILHEGTNNVSIQYGAFSTGQYEGMFDVGLRSAPAGSSTNWINRTVWNNWADSNPGTSATDKCRVTSSVYPVIGTTYLFVAPAVSGIPSLPVNLSPSNTAVNVSNPALLSWRDDGGWTTGYRLYFGTNNPPTNIHNGTDIGYVYSETLQLQHSTQYYWRIAPYNSIGENSSGPVRSFTTVAPPLYGNIYVGGVGAHYPDLTLAINDLNIRGVGEGGLYVNLNQDTFSGSFPAITATGYEDRPIVFKPAPGFSPVINSTGGSSSSCFKLVGSDYVSFENLTINGGSTQYGFWVVGSVADEAKNISIKDCVINMPYVSTQNFGILVDGVTDSLRIENNVISGPFNGIYVSGGSNAYLESKNVLISGNQISGSRNYGIYAFNSSMWISANTISLSPISSSNMYGIYCGWGGGIYNVSQNTIQNGSTTRYFYGLFSQSNNAIFSENTVQNCGSTEDAVYGTYSSGISEFNNNLFTGLSATNRSDLYGIYLYSGTHIAHGNQIKDINSTGDIYGIYARAHNHTITANQIMGLHHSGTRSSQVCGIYVSSATLNNIHNNMIGDLSNPLSSENLQISGIQIASGTTHNIYHNTILLDPGTYSGYGSCKSAALYISGSTTSDIRNNIFINKIQNAGSPAVSAAIWKTTAGLENISVSSNGNIYYVLPNQSSNCVAQIGSTKYNTLASYQAISGARDQNSFTEDVPFVSSVNPFNLRINPSVATVVESGAIPIPGFAHDFEGDLRHSSTPDVGADEGNFTPLITDLASPIVSISYDNGYVVVNWDPVPHASYYKVFHSVSPDIWNYNSYHTTTATQYISVPWQTGFYRVRAIR